MRPIKPIQLANDFVPAELGTTLPRFVHVAPESLFVDPQYQRDLSARSVALIEKIIRQWDWRAFKPPIATEVDGDLHLIDGQHTAIGAASHPGIERIPVMVVEAIAIEDRALAFVRHNRDRIAVSQLDVHFAEVAAGDETALTVDAVCQRAGIRLLRIPPPLGRWKVGDSMTVSGIRALIGRRHAMGARIVLETAVKGQAKPVTALLIRAIERLLYEEEYKGEISPEDIVSVLLAGDDLERDAKRFATERKVPLFCAMASVIFMKRKRRRRGQG